MIVVDNLCARTYVNGSFIIQRKETFYPISSFHKGRHQDDLSSSINTSAQTSQQNYKSIEISTHFSSLDWSIEEEEWFIIFSLLKKIWKNWTIVFSNNSPDEWTKENERAFAIDAAKIS